MPHVDIKCYAGRNDEQKRECADQIVEVFLKDILSLQRKEQLSLGSVRIQWLLIKNL